MNAFFTFFFFYRIKMAKGGPIALFLPRVLKLCWAVGSSPRLLTRDSSLRHSPEPNAGLERTRAASLERELSLETWWYKRVSRCDAFSLRRSLVISYADSADSDCCCSVVSWSPELNSQQSFSQPADRSSTTPLVRGHIVACLFLARHCAHFRR